MVLPSAPVPPAQPCTHDLPGLEVDNLLAFLALLGLLRSLEAETGEPGWEPRSSWSGPPWRARLHLARQATPEQVAKAAAAGAARIAAEFDSGGRSNVDFDRKAFRDYARHHRHSVVGSALAAALTAELPAKRDDSLFASPLVFMFGQGHDARPRQPPLKHRLIAAARNPRPNRFRHSKPTPSQHREQRPPRPLKASLRLRPRHKLPLPRLQLPGSVGTGSSATKGSSLLTNKSTFVTSGR